MATEFRTDIQALRGLAVLMVVLYHTKIGSLEAGYLGVDVFFVISGFLITTLVASGIYRGGFRLSDFYFRRAKRLLPAAYVTFLLTALLAPWFLNQQELRDFTAQMLGAITFTGNFVLWQQTGYFEGSGDLKPLLHVWSLSLEEQYYFLLPAVLLLTRPSRWLWGASALLLISFLLCVFGGMWKPVATFYLLPTRAWELLIGSVGALWILRTRTTEFCRISGVVRLLFVPSLLCLLVLPFIPFRGGHPGVNAFLVCIATLIIILRNSVRLNSSVPTKCLATVGDFSYSLYLVHWPIIALMKNAWVGSSSELPIGFRLTALVLSFSLAYLLYRLVEDPVRRIKFGLSRKLVGKVAFSSALLVSISPITMYANSSQIDFKEVRRTNFGFSEACEYKTLFTPRSECQNSENPNLLVWGDSFAMHLIPGLANEWKGGGVIQATRSVCGPFLGLAPRNITEPEHNKAWAEKCIAFNQSVIDFLKITPSIEFVVLSSPFSQYVIQKNYEHIVQQGKLFLSVPVSRDTAQASLHRTVEEIRALGKKVILIAPPPASDFDIGACLERQLSGTVAFGGRTNCLIDRTDYQSKRIEVLDFLKSSTSAVDVSVIRFDPWLCNSDSCATLLDNTMIYRDNGHLSYDGSKLLAARMQLARLIREQAK